ncbi:adenylate kinase [Paractinoplanes brasiliensis]|uniref:Adenylate kinase family enzyme n=1 Tax=Paractinoplanes brasiliensis TaxID=52695 RepID=A0A4R6JZ93_9ACTN|nr:adenylate kinase [Actinoplanes brasiliensis]TDO41081.1 adenylate kinase family enzyme [Actinoplanes brasiliensis]
MRRILVYGVTGSGKSTLAARIGERLGLPYHSIDDLMWQPGWVPLPPDQQREVIEKLLAADEWVIDAAYGYWHDLVLARAELIVGLDLPRRRSGWRLLRRTVTRIVRRTPACNGNYETWRASFFDRDSILWFHVHSYARKRRRMRQWQASPEFPETVLLRTPAEVERWLEAQPS